MASVRLMALSACRRSSLFLQRCAMQSFKARFTFPMDVTQVIISHARLLYYFCGMLYLATAWRWSSRNALARCELRSGVLCGSCDHLRKECPEWSCKMTRFAALPTESNATEGP